MGANGTHPSVTILIHWELLYQSIVSTVEGAAVNQKKTKKNCEPSCKVLADLSHF